MKVSFFILAIYLILPTLAGGQPTTVTWGPLYDYPSRCFIQSINEDPDSKDIFLLFSKKGGLFGKEENLLARFNHQDLRLSKQQIISSLQNKNELKIVGICFDINSLYLFYTSELNKNQYLLAQQSFSKNDLNTNAPVTILDTLYTNHSPSFNLIKGNKAWAITGTYFNNKTGQPCLANYYFTTILQPPLSYKSNLGLTYQKSEIIASEIIGNTLFTLFRKEEEKAGLFSDNPLHYVLLANDLTNGASKEFDLNLPDKSLTSAGLKKGLNNQLLLCGFFSKRTTQQASVAGAFYLRIDETTLTITGKGITEFDPTTLAKFMSERKASKGRELKGFEIDFVIATSDDGAVILSEQFMTNQVCNTDPRTGAMYCNDYYHYEDIIALKFNNSGQLNWVTKIPKQQVTVNDRGYFSSYFYTLNKDYIELFYNDDPYNFSVDALGNIRNVSNFRKSTPAVISLKKDGSLDRNLLSKQGGQGIIMRPKIHTDSNTNNTLVIGEKRGNYALGRITSP